MKNVIVSGASGYLGSMFVKMLIYRGVNVIALMRHGTTTQLAGNNRLTHIIIDDLTDVSVLINTIPEREYDAFYHFAWQGVNGIEKSDPIVQIENIRIAVSCAQIAKGLNCKKFLCAGTIAERAIESLPHLDKVSGGMMYSAGKVATRLVLDTYCRNIGLPFVWMQFSNVFGPGNKTGNLISYTLNQLSKNQPATFGSAEQFYDFIYIDDLLEAVYRIGNIAAKAEQFFIGSGESRYLKDYLSSVGQICGKKELIKIGERPDDGILYAADMFDTSPLKSYIGDYVSVSFEEGIQRTWRTYLCT